MVFLVKTQGGLRLYYATNEESLINRLHPYNPIFEILHSCDGTQKIITKVKEEVSFTDGGVESSEEIISKIIEVMDLASKDLISETKEFILKRYEFLMSKIKRYAVSGLESAYTFDNGMNSENLCTGFHNISSRVDIVKAKDSEISEKINEIETYIRNIQKAMDCKRFCDDIEDIQILPDTTVSIKNYGEEENVSIKQVTSINNKDIYEIRLVSNFDFNYI